MSYSFRQNRATGADQSDLICAPQLMIAGEATATRIGGYARVLPGQPPSLAVTDPAGPGWMPWDDSWDERRPYPCAMCAFRAPACDICAGRTPGAAKQPTFNPWVLGSSPRRPTNQLYGSG